MQALRLLMAAAVASLAAAQPVSAQEDWPSKPVKIIVPWPAGGIVDARVRLLAARLSRALEQQVLIENRAGASGTLGAQAAARAAPDGYTLLAGSFVDQAMASSLFRSLAYDPERDFVPIANIGRACLLLVVNESLGVSSLEEFIALARSRPGQLTYASAGIGTPQHLLMERLKKLAQIQLEHLPYKGGGPALQDVVAGHVPVTFDFAPTAFAHVQSGKLKPLVTACGHRIDIFPQVPSAAEAGYPQLELIGWGGIFAPKGTSATIVQRLNREINQIIVAPDVRSHVAMAGSTYPLWSPEEFAEFIRNDRPRWGEIARAAGIEPQ